MYTYGLSVDPDPRRAFALFLDAAKQGNVRAQYNLGKMYRDGDGTEKDFGAAVAWYRRAADKGYAKA